MAKRAIHSAYSASYVGGMRKLLSAALVFLFLSLVLTHFSEAEQKELKTESVEKLDAVLLLDSSGSMRLTDPARLRDEGVKLFTQFLKIGDRLALIEFSKEARLLRPLQDFNPDATKELAADLAKIDNSGYYTDILSGVRAAKKLLEENSRADATQVILLLSDGKMEPDPAIATAEINTNEIFNADLPELKSRGIRVHTLSFSDLADKDILSQIAAATDGTSMFTPTSEKIHESFANLFLAIKKPQVLPLTSKGFKIDSNIQEATFYLNKGESSDVSLETPSGAKIFAGTKNDQIRWFRGQQFEVVTILQPESGDWKVYGLPPGESFATVLTNLKLLTDWPNKVTAEEKVILQARIYESDKPVVLREMTDAVKYAFQITPTDKVAEPVVRSELHDDGVGGDKAAGDGIFSSEVQLDSPGEYTIKVVAKAPTFERYLQIPFKVVHRMVTLSIGRPEGHGESHAAAGKSEHGSKAHDSKESSHGDEHAPASSGHDEHAKDEHAAADHSSEGHEKSEHGKDEHRANDEKGTAHSDAAADEHSTAESKDLEPSDEDVFIARLSPESRELKNLTLKVLAVDSERTRYEISMHVTEDPLVYEAPVKGLKKEGSYKVQANLQGQTRGKKSVKSSSETITYFRKPEVLSSVVVTEDAHKDPEHVVVEEAHKEEHKEEHAETPTVESKEPSPLIPIAIVTVINLVAGAVVMLMIKKLGKGPTVTLPEFQSLDGAKQALAKLIEIAGATEVDLNDPALGSRAKESGDVPASEQLSEEEAAAEPDLTATDEAPKEGEETAEQPAP